MNTVGEEVKIMKELRILFSNKQNSRAIKILMVVFALFFLLLIGLGAFQLSMINKQIQDFSDLMNFAMLAGSRLRVLGDLTTTIRQYQTITWTRSLLPAAYVSIYAASSHSKVIFRLDN